jgi:ribosomal protein S25
LIVTDFLDEKRREISDRLAELGPLVEEYHRLEAAAAALVGIGGKAVAAVTPRRRGRPPGSGTKTAAAPAAKKRGRPPGRPKKVGRPKTKKVGRPAGGGAKAAAAATATTAAPAKRRAGRRKGSGTRAAQALTFVKGQPGITIPELAAKMGIKQNYLYRVLPALEQEGKLKKQGRGWHPKS